MDVQKERERRARERFVDYLEICLGHPIKGCMMVPHINDQKDLIGFQVMRKDGVDMRHIPRDTVIENIRLWTPTEEEFHEIKRLWTAYISME